MGLPLDDASKERVVKRLAEFDLILASQILNFTSEELQQIVRLPDVLDGLGLQQSRSSLLYALGHEAVLREEGSIPQEETPESVAELFTLLASQPVSSNPHGSVIFNEADSQCLVSRVQGVRVAVHHPPSDVSVLAAEAVIGSIEAFFATAIELGAAAHTENFTVTLQESSEVDKPGFTIGRCHSLAGRIDPCHVRPTGRRPEDADRLSGCDLCCHLPCGGPAESGRTSL
jgi:hypothetical protein